MTRLQRSTSPICIKNVLCDGSVLPRCSIKTSGSLTVASIPFNRPPESVETKNVCTIMNAASLVNAEFSTMAPETGPSYILRARKRCGSNELTDTTSRGAICWNTGSRNGNSSIASATKSKRFFNDSTEESAEKNDIGIVL